MKYFIENNLKRHKTIFKNPAQVLEHLFATLGNGIDLDNKGYLEGNYRDAEAFQFGEPIALTHIYPWSETEEYQPFRKYAGCRDVGFKEAAEYFIECIEMTPNTVEGIVEWKLNLDIVGEVLLDTPTLRDKYSLEEMDAFIASLQGKKTTSQHPLDGTKIDAKNSVYKAWFFDVQWSDCPMEIEDEIRASWRAYELGNDHYFWKATLDQELFSEYPKIYFWLKHKGVPEGETVLIHWWW